MLEDFAVDLHGLHNKIRNNKLSLWILTSPLGKSATNLQRIRYRNWNAEDLKSTLHVNFHLDTVQFFSALYVLDFLKFHARCCYNNLPHTIHCSVSVQLQGPLAKSFPQLENLFKCTFLGCICNVKGSVIIVLNLH